MNHNNSDIHWNHQYESKIEQHMKDKKNMKKGVLKAGDKKWEIGVLKYILFCIHSMMHSDYPCQYDIIVLLIEYWILDPSIKTIKTW